MPDPDIAKAKEVLIARISDYTRTFKSVSGRKVLKDLRKSFCTALGDPNPFEMARKVGSFEVVAKIEAILKLSKNKKGLEDLFRKPEDTDFDPEAEAE